MNSPKRGEVVKHAPPPRTPQTVTIDEENWFYRFVDLLLLTNWINPLSIKSINLSMGSEINHYLSMNLQTSPVYTGHSNKTLSIVSEVEPQTRHNGINVHLQLIKVDSGRNPPYEDVYSRRWQRISYGFFFIHTQIRIFNDASQRSDREHTIIHYTPLKNHLVY